MIILNYYTYGLVGQYSHWWDNFTWAVSGLEHPGESLIQSIERTLKEEYHADWNCKQKRLEFETKEDLTFFLLKWS